MTVRSGAIGTAIVGGLSADSTQVAGSVAHQGHGRFNGSGNFSVDPYISPRVVVSFAEVEFTESDRTLQARFDGAGNLRAYAALRQVIAIRYQGSGNLSVDANKYKLGTARFSGAGNLSVDAVTSVGPVQHVGEARFAGSGSFSVLAYVPTGAIVSWAEVEFT